MIIEVFKTAVPHHEDYKPYEVRINDSWEEETQPWREVVFWDAENGKMRERNSEAFNHKMRGSPWRGSFEVWFMGEKLYSKVESGRWPHIPTVAKLCLEAYKVYAADSSLI